MKLLLKILFTLFLVPLLAGLYLNYFTDYEKAEAIIGIAILFLSFILMPLFIYHRHRLGKYKKYVLDGNKKNPFKIDEDKMV